MNSLMFFPPSAGSLGVDVVGCNHRKGLPRKWKPTKRFFDCYVLSFIAGGSAWYESDVAKRQFVSRGSCVLIFPGVGSLYQPCDYHDWEEYSLRFQGPVIRCLESESLLCPDKPVFRIRRNITLLNLFRESVCIAHSRSETAQKRLSGLLLHLLNEILILDKKARMGSMPAGPIPSLVRQIRQNPAKSWDFQAVAREIGMNYHLLRQHFKKIIAQSPHQFVNLERMKLACQYLASGCTVQEACFKIGMEDPYHFSRLFKQIMGRAPVYFQHIRDD